MSVTITINEPDTPKPVRLDSLKPGEQFCFAGTVDDHPCEGTCVRLRSGRCNGGVDYYDYRHNLRYAEGFYPVIPLDESGEPVGVVNHRMRVDMVQPGLTILVGNSLATVVQGNGRGEVLVVYHDNKRDECYEWLPEDTRVTPGDLTGTFTPRVTGGG